MSSTKRDRQLRLRAERRNPPDYQKLGRALIAAALRQAEAEAAAQAEAKRRRASEQTHADGQPDQGAA